MNHQRSYLEGAAAEAAAVVVVVVAARAGVGVARRAARVADPRRTHRRRGCAKPYVTRFTVTRTRLIHACAMLSKTSIIESSTRINPIREKE